MMRRISGGIRLIWGISIHLVVVILFYVFAVFLNRGPAAHANDARVLPPGVFNLNYNYGVAFGVQNQFDAGGSKKSITEPYQFELSAKNFKNFDRQIEELTQYLNRTGLRYDKGVSASAGSDQPLIGDALSRGNLEVNGQANVQAHYLRLMAGITKRFTAGFIVPILKHQVEIDAQITGPNTADAIYQQFEGTESEGFAEIESALNQLRRINVETLQGVLQERGYQRVENWEETGLGDVVAGGRYLLFDQMVSSGQWISSLQSGVTIPTGKQFGPDQVTALSFGKGAWDINGGLLLNYLPGHWISLVTNVNYTHRFASKKTIRLSEDPNDPLPSAQDEERVQAQLGHKYWTTAGVILKPFGPFEIESDFEWFWKGADRFEGTRAGINYDSLSEGTAEYLETLHVGVNVQSVDAYQRGDWPLPASIGFHHYRPIRGKNAPIAPYYLTTFNLYF